MGKALSPDLVKITMADFVVRTAYQMGKTPLLPMFAVTLGASPFWIGTIVSVSTFTGMVAKPIFGFLSDHLGRKLWLFASVALFVTIPFLYVFVTTPDQLLGLRLAHGLATAIFGPVSLAYVAEMAANGMGERQGWFAAGRSGGYLFAPVISAFLLTRMPPEQVFTIIGMISSLAFLPLLLLPPEKLNKSRASVDPRNTSYSLSNYFIWLGHFGKTLWDAAYATGLWLAALIEVLVHIPIYALRAFFTLLRTDHP